MSPQTEVINLPVTGELPVLAPEPSWDAIVRAGRPRRRRVRGRDPLALVGDVAMYGGWVTLMVWLGHLTRTGQLLDAQALPWAP